MTYAVFYPECILWCIAKVEECKKIALFCEPHHWGWLSSPLINGGNAIRTFVRWSHICTHIPFKSLTFACLFTFLKCHFAAAVAAAVRCNCTWFSKNCANGASFRIVVVLFTLFYKLKLIYEHLFAINCILSRF